jgi:LAO/AO transport system kinase
LTDPKKQAKGPDSSINRQQARAFLARKKRLSPETLIQGIREGDRVRLSQAITLVESQKTSDQELAQQVIEGCLPFSGQSLRIGITGAPGVGKSTFIESFGLHVLSQGDSIAVLAIDPSSSLSKGSILGDKTRMGQLANHPNAFIRPSAAGASLGGVARKTRETIFLCEAAGYNRIIVETVGVGQSETAVHSMVDFFLLLLLPGAGDELQGIKRGIVEMADLVAVNKADGDRLPLAKEAKRAYRNALHLFPAKSNGWTVPVEICSSLRGEGMDRIQKALADFQQTTHANGSFEKNRQQQERFWMEETLQSGLKQLFRHHPDVEAAYEDTLQKVLSGQWSSFKAAHFLLDLFTGKNDTEL